MAYILKKLFFTIIIVSFLSLKFLSAQTDSTETPPETITSMLPSVIDTSANLISNSEKGLNYFFLRLKKLQESKLRKLSIYHFGDSHIGAKVMPDKFAQLMQTRYGEAGRKIYEEKIKVKKKSKKKIRRKRARKLAINQNEEIPLTYYAENSYDNLGDNLFMDYVLKDYEDEETAGVARGVYYCSYGYSGKTYKYFSESVKIFEHIRITKPDLVIITLGTNDAYAPNFNPENVKTEVKIVVEKIRKTAPRTSILLIIPPDSFIKRKTPNEKLITVREVLINSATELDLAYWDFYNIMGGTGSMDEWVNKGFATKDKIHFTKPGYRLQAELIDKAFQKAYQEYILKENYQAEIDNKEKAAK